MRTALALLALLATLLPAPGAAQALHWTVLLEVVDARTGQTARAAQIDVENAHPASITDDREYGPPIGPDGERQFTGLKAKLNAWGGSKMVTVEADLRYGYGLTPVLPPDGPRAEVSTKTTVTFPAGERFKIGGDDSGYQFWITVTPS